MHEHNRLAEQFEANRTRLRAVAYHMPGPPGEADDPKRLPGLDQVALDG